VVNEISVFSVVKKRFKASLPMSGKRGRHKKMQFMSVALSELIFGDLERQLKNCLIFHKQF
jgi:hypothetical protein